MMFAKPPTALLPAKVLVLWRLGSLIGAVVFGALACSAGWLWWPGPIMTPLMGTLLALVAANVALETSILLRLRHRAYRYEATANSLRMQTGYLFARHLVVPADQILYVDVHQGPIARWLGLCTVNLGTLGSIHPLGPVEEERAQEIVALYGTQEPVHAT